MKPRLFIGSSVKALSIASALHESVEHDAEVTGWNDSVFEPSKFTLETLMERIENTDFAVFVFNQDDVIQIKEIEHKADRDNVIFELGLFMGRLGRDRCFILQAREAENLRIASDLLGLTPMKFDANREDKNLVAALVPAANQLRRAFATLGTLPSSRLPLALPNFGKGSASWLDEHLVDLRDKIIEEARSLTAASGRSQVVPIDVTRAAMKFAPGVPVRASWFTDRVLGSLSGITIVATLLAVVFGALGVYTDQTVYFDIVKLFAGTILGSAGATVVARPS